MAAVAVKPPGTISVPLSQAIDASCGHSTLSDYVKRSLQSYAEGSHLELGPRSFGGAEGRIITIIKTSSDGKTETFACKMINLAILKRDQYFYANDEFRLAGDCLGLAIKSPYCARTRAVVLLNFVTQEAAFVSNIKAVSKYTGYHVIASLQDFYEAKDLFDYVADIDKLPIQKAKSIAYQILKGLSAFEDVGVMHRDIKPENIIIDDAGKIRIVDFGRVKEKTNLTRRFSKVGSPPYMAPEVSAMQPYDGKIDVYSTGCAVYAIVCKRLPFSDVKSNSAPLLIQKYEQEKQQRLSNLRKELSDLRKEDPDFAYFIDDCTHPDQRQRLSLKQALEHPCFAKIRQQEEGKESHDPSTKENRGGEL